MSVSFQVSGWPDRPLRQTHPSLIVDDGWSAVDAPRRGSPCHASRTFRSQNYRVFNLPEVVVVVILSRGLTSCVAIQSEWRERERERERQRAHYRRRPVWSRAGSGMRDESFQFFPQSLSPQNWSACCFLLSFVDAPDWMKIFIRFLLRIGRAPAYWIPAPVALFSATSLLLYRLFKPKKTQTIVVRLTWSKMEPSGTMMRRQWRWPPSQLITKLTSLMRE